MSTPSVNCSTTWADCSSTRLWLWSSARREIVAMVPLMDTIPQDAPSARRARGAYFTPPALAEFIVRWAVRSGADHVLEPSCGDARFLQLAAEQMRGLQPNSPSGRLEGVELHEPSVRHAERLLMDAGVHAMIRQSSFFDLTGTGGFTAVVGNPPFLRFQDFAGESRASARRRALAAGVRLDGRSNAWAYFVVHAAGFVAPDGRLGLVLPADLLHADYAEDVRSFLLERFGDVRIVAFRKRVFKDAQVDVVVLLAEGHGGASHFKVYEAADLENLGSTIDMQWSSSTLLPEQKWTSALVDQNSLSSYWHAVADERFCELREGWGKASIGAVTGDSAYFRMNAARAKELRLTAEDLLRLFPGWRRSRSDLTFSSSAWEAARSRGEKVFLFWPQWKPSPAAARYIDVGVESAVDSLSGKCADRESWWRVPLAPMADLFVGNVSHHTPVLMCNRANVHHTNAYYGVVLEEQHRRLGRDLLPIAAMNSVSLLAAEILGRAHGKGGLKLAVSEVDAWPVPSPRHVQSVAGELRGIRSKARALVRRGQATDAASLVDGVLFGAQSQEDLLTVRAELQRLRARRATRGGGHAN